MEHILSPQAAFQYAFNVNSTIPELEHVIMMDPETAFYYARDVIGGRWSEGESIILTSNDVTYWYARDVIKGRWHEAEKMIMQCPINSYRYAREVMGSRWYEAEMMIATHSEAAYYYARDVIKGGWDGPHAHLAEAIIDASFYRDVYRVRTRDPFEQDEIEAIMMI